MVLSRARRDDSVSECRAVFLHINIVLSFLIGQNGSESGLYLNEGEEQERQREQQEKISLRLISL